MVANRLRDGKLAVPEVERLWQEHYGGTLPIPASLFEDILQMHPTHYPGSMITPTFQQSESITLGDVLHQNSNLTFSDITTDNLTNLLKVVSTLMHYALWNENCILTKSGALIIIESEQVSITTTDSKAQLNFNQSSELILKLKSAISEANLEEKRRSLSII
jgi:hypothetical protein